jgi:hypothetical protein
MRRAYYYATLLGVFTMAASGAAPAAGPLRVCDTNPRYFTDGSGKAVYLVGSHMWNNLQDMSPDDPPEAFDWDAYMEFMQRYNHNFMRLWRWEPVIWDTSANNLNRDEVHTVAPHPWARTGPGNASDGKPKFDLTRFDESHFERMRERVISAGERGIYVAVMLFEGWALQRMEDAWSPHPFHPKNNINGIGGDVDVETKGVEVHELKHPSIVEIQEAYVRKVIDTVNDLDNVLYEISNENHTGSTEFQYHMIRFIKEYEKTKPKQHPVGMTFQFKGGSNKTLFNSPADWISPNPEGGYRDNPPAADGNKVIITDTDHLWGIGGNQQWVWKSFLRGLNPIFMDPYDGLILGDKFDPKWEPVRRSVGYTLRFAERMNLAAMTPRNGLSSTRYCLANPGSEYLVYQPEAGEVFTVKLEAGKYKFKWFDPSTGEASATGELSVEAGERSFEAPFEGDAVLYLTSAGDG